ncbi:MAG TPA: ABC transporter permease [Chitinophagales bacterium]|nr:ABC transporter permease [Chitinophagales bacterium]HMU69706.1 ABC transporter permease [Chitinophagales bacterium]HMX04081.1 ABC transporter permease [Chitinophagales bacterium]HMZ90571.1 ABC transporter permease [Chitinophagales bacterium]HNA58139.1 ABC transporter permease [Chitinophagales bacterium]
MLRLLKIELHKLLPYRTFKILFIVYLLLMVLWLFAGKGLLSGGPMTPSQILGFPNIWNYYALYACYFNIILAILIIFVTCNEYTYRTLRQNVIDGMQRNETVLGKIYLIILLSIISTLVLSISGVIGGLIFSNADDKSKIFDHSGFIFAYLIQSLGMMSMGYFFGTLFKRTGLAVIIFLIFLFPIDVILREGILPDGSGDYMPVATYFLKMVPWPVSHMMSRGEEPTPGAPTLLAMSVGAAYAVIFTALGWLITKKRDL